MIFYPVALVDCCVAYSASMNSDEVDGVEVRIHPLKVTVERNDHNTADTCTVEIDASRMPVMPRVIRQVLVRVYAGDAGELDTNFDDFHTEDRCVFMGFVDQPEINLSDSDARIIWKARDYTGLYLDIKSPPSTIIPTYADRLDAALRRILDYHFGGENIQLRLEGADVWPELGDIAPKGLLKAKLPVNDGWSAWDMIKAACDLVNLIPSFELDTLVVRVSRGLSSATSEPAFIYGENLLELHESRNLAKLKEGIGLRAYSLQDRKQIVAFFPPEGDRSIQKKPNKKAVRKKQQLLVGVGTVTPGEKRKWFPAPMVQDQEALDAMAERVWRERSIGEFEGSFRVGRMTVRTNLDPEGEADVTKIKNGDRVMLAVDPSNASLVSQVEGFEERVSLLQEVEGFEPATARAMVKIYESGLADPLEVYVRKATHTYDDKYECQVEYQALIDSSTKRANLEG